MRVYDPADGAPQLLEVGERELRRGGDVADPAYAERVFGRVREDLGPLLLGVVRAVREKGLELRRYIFDELAALRRRRYKPIISLNAGSHSSFIIRSVSASAITMAT